MTITHRLTNAGMKIKKRAKRNVSGYSLPQSINLHTRPDSISCLGSPEKPTKSETNWNTIKALGRSYLRRFTSRRRKRARVFIFPTRLPMPIITPFNELIIETVCLLNQRSFKYKKNEQVNCCFDKTGFFFYWKI